ncbi:MAG: MTH938/NDUFAF3 family protein [Candidatus Hermodarchaeota archaeon]|nr:MTH938/NDUFAF3 family protein [Candidatus Hermodarchaeota archaeon]MDO8125159.1 MTH938/NDUFAF3 family protein [Candidatus Hermodarchaeota archaeon]
MRIDDYQFGSIIINGQTYTTDVIVFPDRVRPEWWRLEGHKLLIQDLKCVLQAKPKLLIVGTGYYGKVRIPSTTRKHLSEMDINLIAKDTSAACKLYNTYRTSKQQVIAALHLTC